LPLTYDVSFPFRIRFSNPPTRFLQVQSSPSRMMAPGEEAGSSAAVGGSGRDDIGNSDGAAPSQLVPVDWRAALRSASTSIQGNLRAMGSPQLERLRPREGGERGDGLDAGAHFGQVDSGEDGGGDEQVPQTMHGRRAIGQSRTASNSSKATARESDSIDKGRQRSSAAQPNRGGGDGGSGDGGSISAKDSEVVGDEVEEGEEDEEQETEDEDMVEDEGGARDQNTPSIARGGRNRDGETGRETSRGNDTNHVSSTGGGQRREGVARGGGTGEAYGDREGEGVGVRPRVRHEQPVIADGGGRGSEEERGRRQTFSFGVPVSPILSSHRTSPDGSEVDTGFPLADGCQLSAMQPIRSGGGGRGGGNTTKRHSAKQPKPWSVSLGSRA